MNFHRGFGRGLRCRALIFVSFSHRFLLLFIFTVSMYNGDSMAKLPPHTMKIITSPLLAASVALLLALAWSKTYSDANNEARTAAEKVRPWTQLARDQMVEVGACENKARAGAQEKYPDPSAAMDREIVARSSAFACASAYLMAQPRVSASVAAQVLGYEAGVSERRAALGLPLEIPASLDPLFSKAAADARAASRDAELADKSIMDACQGFIAGSVCAVAKLTPDRPDRRMGDAMREFEIDVHAQREIALHPSEEIAARAKTGDASGRDSPAYLKARAAVYAAR